MIHALSKLQLWSGNKIVSWFTTLWGNAMKGLKLRRLENHCFKDFLCSDLLCGSNPFPSQESLWLLIWWLETWCLAPAFLIGCLGPAFSASLAPETRWRFVVTGSCDPFLCAAYIVFFYTGALLSKDGSFILLAATVPHFPDGSSALESCLSDSEATLMLLYEEMTHGGTCVSPLSHCHSGQLPSPHSLAL